MIGPRRLVAHLPRLLRQLIASSLATAVDTAVLFALCWGLGVAPGPAAVAGCLAGGAVNFTVSRAWVFRAGGPRWSQAIRYAVIVVGGGAVVSGLAVAALTAAGLPLPLAKLVAVAVVLVAWTHPMSARLVFAAPRRHAAAPARAS